MSSVSCLLNSLERRWPRELVCGLTRLIKLTTEELCQKCALYRSHKRREPLKLWNVKFPNRRLERYESRYRLAGFATVIRLPRRGFFQAFSTREFQDMKWSES